MAVAGDVALQAADGLTRLEDSTETSHFVPNEGIVQGIGDVSGNHAREGVVRRFAVVLAAAAMTMSSPSFTGFSQVFAAYADATPTPSEQAEIQLRSESGLEYDLAYVRSVDASVEPNLSELGIPLLPAEAARIAVRDNLDSVIAAVDNIGSSVPGYAGAWIDQAGGGILHIGVVNLTDTVQALFADVIPTGVNPEFDNEVTSMIDLQATEDAIFAVMQSNATLRSAIVMTGVKPSLNTVQVLFTDGTSSEIVNDLLEAIPTAAVTISYTSATFDAQSDRNRTSGRLYGGEWMSSPSSNCTVGYSNLLSNASSNKYSITAGHCGYGNWYQGKSEAGEFVGYVHSESNLWSYGGTSYCDCESIGPLPTGYATNHVISLYDNLLQLTQTAPSSDYDEGLKVCLSGAASKDQSDQDEVCGYMINPSGSATYGASSYTLLDAGITDIDSTLGGDSGAPYFKGSDFLGIHAALSLGLNATAISKTKHMSGTGATPVY